MEIFESFEESEDLQQYGSVYMESEGGEVTSQAESGTYHTAELSQSHGPPTILLTGSAESWEETDVLQGCESEYLESNKSKKKSASKSKDEEDIDLLIIDSQQNLDVLMSKTTGTINNLDQRSEKIDCELLNKPVGRKKSKKQKESGDTTEDFGAVPERKKSKKQKDKDIDESLVDESEDADKKKKKGKKKDSKSIVTSRAPSPTPIAPTDTEIEKNGETTEHRKKSVLCGLISSENPYRGIIADRFKKITGDINHLDTEIYYLKEKENLLKIRMFNQKYWNEPELKNNKEVKTKVQDEYISHSPNQCAINSRISEKSSGVTMHKTVYNYMPITLSYQIINPAPVSTYRPASTVDNNTLALAYSMTKLATSHLEEARVKRKRDDKLININNKLMNSLQSLGRCVENLAVNSAPMHANQYNSMPTNITSYQAQLCGTDAETRNQKPVYIPGNMSYDKYPWESMQENRRTGVSEWFSQ